MEKSLLSEVGAEAVTVASDPELLPLLDQQKVDYVLMSMTTLEQSLQRGFSDRYQVVFSGSELRVPIAMAAHLQDPMLQQILTKVLLSIPGGAGRPGEEVALLTIHTGLDPHKVLLWSSLGGGFFCSSCCCSWAGTGLCAARSVSGGRRSVGSKSSWCSFR